MANPKDVLVITTSTVEGLKIKKYLKPVSAHIVAGTNLFSDFFGGLTDVFGGRSQNYQKQLTSLYSEAIERIKFAAYEIGANGILGLNIDMDEISGKGKSMFMLTAIGTAVILEKESNEKNTQSGEKFENVGVERINTLRNKKVIIGKANSGNLGLNDETWSFITSNQVYEVFPFLLKKFYESLAKDHNTPGTSQNFYKRLLGYVDALPGNIKIDLLYRNMKKEDNEQIAVKISEIIEELNLLDINRSMELLNSDDFQIQKRGLRIITYDKPFYSKQDKKDLQTLRDFIKNNFEERGTRSTKKQLLSSKDKEVWTCECGKTNDVGSYCSSCKNDIYGFKENESNPLVIDKYIEQKIELINEYLE